MTPLRVERYRAEDAADWNAFVATSRNGTFLFDRRFMDYHAERFDDHSLVLREGDRIVALLPAHRRDDALVSHAGLTYGGLVLGARSGAADVLAMFDALRRALHAMGFARLAYKTVPSIYHRQPSEDDRYALFRHDARLVRRDVLSVLAPGDRLPLQERRRRGARAAYVAGVRVAESRDFAGFWPVLDRVLRERHGVAPVHSIDEITRLAATFPDAIRLFTAMHHDAIVAGVVVFETATVAHVQYIAADEQGRTLHALDLLFSTLLDSTFADKPWFDFGISNEEAGRVLNAGLVAQKEGFGARTVVHDHYELEVAP